MLNVTQRVCLVLTLAYSSAACQIVTGLDELEADGLGVAADGGGSAGAAKSMPQVSTRAGAGAGGGTSEHVRPMVPAVDGGDAGALPPQGGSPASVPPRVRDEDAGMIEVCSTRISYGSAWIRSSGHAESWDDVDGVVTWDGKCEIDASGNSVAQLSNGWRPFFAGPNSCVISLDVRGKCAPAGGCSTRVGYGGGWLRPEPHDASVDDIDGAVTTNGQCFQDVDSSYYLTLSNGFRPHFNSDLGKDSCGTSFRYSQCGELFANPVVAADCPDPSVLQDGDRYVLACTSERPEFPLQVSSDLVHWKPAGSIFGAANKPQWADSELWAPELQRVGGRYVAYYNARHRDGDFAIGVATASDVLGPYQDKGEPLLRQTHGVIEPHAFVAPDGTAYLAWKVNSSSGEPTQIRLQPLAADGLALMATPITVLSSSEPWEAGQVHAPWLSYSDGYYYLFYTGDVADKSAIGVARATALMGPYTKYPVPIVSSAGEWVGPATGSLVRSHGGNCALLFHAWTQGYVGQTPPGRQLLVTRVDWQDGWPSALGAPSSLSQPLP